MAITAVKLVRFLGWLLFIFAVPFSIGFLNKKYLKQYKYLTKFN
jgi:hypothetical protein